MNDDVRFWFSGDFCSTPKASFITVSQELRELLQSCDLRFCNLESPILPDRVNERIKGRLYQANDVPAFLEELGFDFLSFANNHAFDYGDEGFIKTRKSFTHAKLLGAGTIEEAYRIEIIECKGLKIGLFALSFAGKRGMFDVLEKIPLGCAYINDLRVNHCIIEAKKQVDYLIVLPHDGIEYIDIPLPETRARYKDFIDYGADAVIACHPHCPQGWESYKGKPIFYSLGNFFFNSKETPDFKTSLPYWYNGLGVVLSISKVETTYEVFSTLNVANRKLSLDKSQKTKEHLHKVCEVLVAEQQYRECLRKVVEVEADKRLRGLVRYFRGLTLKYGFFSFVHNVLDACLKRKNNGQLLASLRGDTERNLMVRKLRFYSK